MQQAFFVSTVGLEPVSCLTPTVSLNDPRRTCWKNVGFVRKRVNHGCSWRQRVVRLDSLNSRDDGWHGRCLSCVLRCCWEFWFQNLPFVFTDLTLIVVFFQQSDCSGLPAHGAITFLPWKSNFGYTNDFLFRFPARSRFFFDLGFRDADFCIAVGAAITGASPSL